MNLELEPRKPWWRRALSWPWKAYIWLRNRRATRNVANALMDNKLAVTALAGAVAAGGVGVYGVHEARDASQEARAATYAASQLAVRVAAVETAQALSDARVALLEREVKALDKKSAAQIRELDRSLDRIQRDMLDLADDLASLPPQPDLKPLYERAAATAKKADEASRQALIATTAAAEQHDPAAREAAKAASVAAADAGWAAKEAVKEALAASSKADEALARPIPTQTPGYQPFPRTVSVPDDTRAVNALPYTSNFTVDLPRGKYTLTVDADVETGPNQHWQGGLLAPRTTGTGPGHLTQSFEINAPGGTITRTFYFDADVNAPGSITVKDIVVTIEKL